jgi:hypothetical protein
MMIITKGLRFERYWKSLSGNLFVTSERRDFEQGINRGTLKLSRGVFFTLTLLSFDFERRDCC